MRSPTRHLVAVTLLAAVLTACTKDVPPYVGPRWTLSAIDHDGVHTTAPANTDAHVRFTRGGRLDTRDTVNGGSASYTPTDSGFTVGDGASTSVGYSGTDPTELLVITAMDSIVALGTTGGPTQPDPHITARMSGQGLVLSNPSYVLSFRRSETTP